jgi:hypothetical protein
MTTLARHAYLRSSPWRCPVFYLRAMPSKGEGVFAKLVYEIFIFKEEEVSSNVESTSGILLTCGFRPDTRFFGYPRRTGGNLIYEIFTLPRLRVFRRTTLLRRA